MKVRLIYGKDRLLLTDSRGRALREANKFLTTLRVRGLSSHTVRAYAQDLQHLFSWLHSPAKIRLLDMTNLCEFIDRQRKANSSPRSINRRLSTIGLFYRFVTGKPLPISLPWSGYRARTRDRSLGVHRIPHKDSARMRVKVPRELIIPLTTEQVQSLIKHFVRYRDLAICYLMLLCGLRAQEVLNIEKGDLQPLDKTLRVHGKGNKERILPLPEIVCDLVAKYLSFERPTDCCTNSLFVALQGSQRGKPMTVAGLRSLFRTRRSTPGLANVHPHLLRHTFGSTMASRGISLPILQRMMGHAFPETTMQYVNLAMSDVVEQFRQATAKAAESTDR